MPIVVFTINAGKVDLSSVLHIIHVSFSIIANTDPIVVQFVLYLYVQTQSKIGITNLLLPIIALY